MKHRELDITIGPDGTVEVRVQGYKGKECLDVAQAFAKVVGEEQSRQLTSEYYDPEEHVRFRLDQRQG